MKNSRIIKTLALIIAISMITAFTACGEDKNTSNNKTDTTTSTQTKPTNDDTVSIVEFEDDEEGVDIIRSWRCKENNFSKDRLEEWYGISCRKWSDDC